MIAARRVGGPAYTETIEEADRELNNVIEDFGRAIDVEALPQVNRSGKQPFPQ